MNEVLTATYISFLMVGVRGWGEWEKGGDREKGGVIDGYGA